MKRTTAMALSVAEAEEQTRLATYGPVPINPFKGLRLHHDLTLAAFASLCDVSKQALIRLEQGTFNEPLPRVVDYCVANYPISYLDLMDGYELFQHQMRARHHRYFGDMLFSLSNAPSEVHPLRVLRGTTNPTEVAKALCIPQATLVYFERRPLQQKSVPKLLLQVLREIGYYKHEVDTFEEHYAKYRDVVVGSHE